MPLIDQLKQLYNDANTKQDLEDVRKLRTTVTTLNEQFTIAATAGASNYEYTASATSLLHLDRFTNLLIDYYKKEGLTAMRVSSPLFNKLTVTYDTTIEFFWA